MQNSIILPDALSYLVAAGEENMNTSRGLLGNFNGNPADDFTTPDGIRISTSANLSDIHYRFGMTWNVSANDSLFSYPTGRNYSSYQNPSFVPSLHMPTASELSPEARAICGDSSTCLFDVQSTGGNLAFANNTVKQEERVKSIAETLNTTVVLCTQPNVSQYAVISTTNGYFNGSIATLICATNSSLYGNNITNCLNGVWINQFGDCTRTISLDTSTSTKISTPSDKISMVLTTKLVNEGIGLFFKQQIFFAFVAAMVVIIFTDIGFDFSCSLFS